MAEDLVTVPQPNNIEHDMTTSMDAVEETSYPPNKKPKLQELRDKKQEKLEHRLGGILCCAVCLDLPRTSVFQCTNGHLMCAGCFTHLLADARLRDETASCPNCRTVISKDLCSRNLAVEKAVSELPAECQYCSRELPRSQLEYHETELCEERLTRCCYNRIGCQWLGPHHERSAHEQVCSHPSKRGADVMGALEALFRQQLEEQQLYCRIFDLLSFEKIAFNDLQFKPYRTDEFVHKLYYETSRFGAFGNQWVVKAYVNDNQRDPTQSCERSLSYQLILKSKVNSSVDIHYLILRGPFGDMKVHPRLYHFEFSDNNAESSHHLLALHDSAECNKLLAAKVINIRLIMFLVTK